MAQTQCPIVPITTHTTIVNSQALSVLTNAFERLEGTITIDQARSFRNTTLQDVCKAAREVEKQLAARQSLRNMRRLQPLLKGLEHFSKVIEVLCNGTDYLSWIWVNHHWQAEVTCYICVTKYSHLGSDQAYITSVLFQAPPKFLQYLMCFTRVDCVRLH